MTVISFPKARMRRRPRIGKPPRRLWTRPLAYAGTGASDECSARCRRHPGWAGWLDLSFRPHRGDAWSFSMRPAEALDLADEMIAVALKELRTAPQYGDEFERAIDMARRLVRTAERAGRLAQLLEKIGWRGAEDAGGQARGRR